MDDIKDVKFVELKESNFVKPYRMLYKQDGKEKVWDCIRSHSSVAVLIFNKTRNVFVFVEQFRPAVFSARCSDENGEIPIGKSWNDGVARNGITLELCAGIIDKKMSEEDIGVAEVFEECGYQVKPESLERISSCLGSVGLSGSRSTIFYAEVTDEMKVSDGGGLASEGEMITVREMSVKQTRAYMASPFVNSPTGFLMAVNWFLANKSQKYKL